MEPSSGISWRPGAELTLRVESVEIRLRAMTLEEVLRAETFDAVVSSDDAMLSMSGGVSAAIRQLAGPVRDEVANELPLAVGSVAITSGGRLALKHVIHAVTIDRARGIKPTPRTIHRVMREILSRCEALAIRRLLIPALATGAAGLEAETSAAIVARALREHTINPTSLQAVTLPVPNAEVRQAFARELAGPLSEEITAGIAMPDEVHGMAGSLESTATTEPRPPIGTSFLQRVRSFGRAPGREPEELTRPADPADHQVATTIHDPASPPVLSRRYVLLEELGPGGMGIVYLAWDLVLQKNVAVKVVRRGTGDVASLKREAAAALELTHPCIVRTYHFEPAERLGTSYLVMEYLSWPSGEKWIADAGDAGLPTASVARVGARIADALAYAHSQHLLHLDIKPSNVFVDPGAENAKLGDFGLARVANDAGSALMLRPSGTPAYMAPEQKEAGAKVSSATDVYQLGATLWDFLTGHPPEAAALEISRHQPERSLLLQLARSALAPTAKDRPSAAEFSKRVASL